MSKTTSQELKDFLNNQLVEVYQDCLAQYKYYRPDSKSLEQSIEDNNGELPEGFVFDDKLGWVKKKNTPLENLEQAITLIFGSGQWYDTFITSCNNANFLDNPNGVVNFEVKTRSYGAQGTLDATWHFSKLNYENMIDLYKAVNIAISAMAIDYSFEKRPEIFEKTKEVFELARDILKSSPFAEFQCEIEVDNGYPMRGLGI